MGRHSAAAPQPATQPVPHRSSPITDPSLLDRPLAPAPSARTVAPRATPSQPSAAPVRQPQPATRATVSPQVRVAPVQPLGGARPAPSAAVAPHAATRPVAPLEARTALPPHERFASAPARPASARPVDGGAARDGQAPAGGSAFARGPRPAAPPSIAGPSLLRQQGGAFEAPATPTRAPSRGRSTLPAAAPRGFFKGREAALAACAVAVVGAAASAAALLPTTSGAEAAQQVDPVTSPVPTTSPSGSTGPQQFCLTPGQLKRAMRHHHHRRATSSASASARPTAATPAPTASSTRVSPVAAATTAPRATSIPAIAGALPKAPSNLGAGTFTLSDFVTQNSGAVISGGVLKGQGVGKTVVQMTPGTSSKASLVPSNGNNQGGLSNPVNPLYLLRGVSDLEDVTVQGTAQGHMYNGLYMTGANLVIKHAEVNDMPGNSNANPGETFAVGINRATGTGTIDDLTINGGTGSLASAAGLAINNSDASWNITDLVTNDLKYSAGIALWQVRGTFDIRNWKQSGGARSLGAERMAGTVNLYDPVWSAGSTGHDVTYTWDGGYSGGSINFYYSSASKVPDRKIRIITNKASGIAGSVHVYVGGVQKTTSDYVTVS